MSYILDALKKAAEQRGDGAPGFRRVVSAPAAPVDTRRTWMRVGLIALCAVAAGAVAFAAVRRTADVTAVLAPQPGVLAPQAPVATPPAAVVAPPAAVVTPRPGVVTSQPAAVPAQPTVGGRALAETRRAPAPVSAAPRIGAPVGSSPREQPPAPRIAAAPSPVIAVTPRPQTAVPAVTPEPALPTPASVADANTKLKLEVLVYSDVASDRMVFINGRKYVQGDTVAEHTRVEEIQPDGVVLSEQGRRFTLRH
jgi:hypothetical protein